MARSLADSERQAYEAHIATLKEEVTYLRGLLQPQPQVQMVEPAMANQLYTSEDEEDAKELLDAGIIDKDEYTSMLEAAGALSTDIDFHPTP